MTAAAAGPFACDAAVRENDDSAWFGSTRPRRMIMIPSILTLLRVIQMPHPQSMSRILSSLLS